MHTAEPETLWPLATKGTTVSVLWFIISVIVIGLIAGLIARAVVPGRQSMGIGATIVLGIVGSLVFGTIASLLPGGTPFSFNFAGIIGSIIGAIVVLLIYIAVRRRR